MPAKQTNKLLARRGRPRKADGPALPHDEVDHLLVHGKVFEGTGDPTEDGGVLPVRFPTYRELGRRYGVSHTVIARFSRDHNCLHRRKRFQDNVRDRADEKLAELRADCIALTENDILRTIDRFATQFEEALKDGRVRCDSAADFNTMVRLRSFILGEVESRNEVVNGMPPLEELVARFKESQRRWENSTPAMRGEVPLVQQVSPPSPTPTDDDDNIIDAEWEEVPGHEDDDVEVGAV